MSKISVSSPAAGTATYTISAPAGSTDRTITLPDQTGTILTTATPGVPVNGPAFSAFMAANQNVSSATFTKVQFNTKGFDTNTNYDIGLFRFTPTVAGYYQVNAVCRDGTGSVTGVIGMFIYKNGAPVSVTYVGAAGYGPSPATAPLVYMNGSTDYLEVYYYQNSGATTAINSTSSGSYFQAFLARSAT